MKANEYQTNYDLEQSYWWFSGVRTMVFELLALAGAPERLGRVLDLGCGTGSLLDALAPRADELWGLDFSREALAFCRRRGHQRLLQADAARVPLASERFDVVTAIGLVEHVPDDRACMEELWRVLKPGGILVLLTSACPWLWSMHDVANEHERRYTLSRLRGELEGVGFETIRFSHLNFFLFPALAGILLGHRALHGVESEAPRRILPRIPALANGVLARVLEVEAKLMRHVPLPYGVSMIGAFRRSS